VLASSVFIEIPGPTRKVPPPKISGSDTNEVTSKNGKNQQSSGKESHLPAKNNQNQEYEDDYSKEDDDDPDGPSGEIRTRNFCHGIELIS
jgi:hypothetical protein